MSELPYGKNNKTDVPYLYYLQRYEKCDPAEIAARCCLPYDAERRAFWLHYLGRDCLAFWPTFSLLGLEDFPALRSPGSQLLLLRHLTEGWNLPASGKFLSYREMPWGNVYDQNFQGRCLKRLAFTFGFRVPVFEKLMISLGASTCAGGDAGYELAFLSGLSLRLFLWGADDEFAPAAQILFSDNFSFAFSAEDMAVVGDVLIDALKELAG